MEQIPNIQYLDEVFEPINSPEYNQYCKEVGLVLSYVGGKYLHYRKPDGGQMTIVYHPLFDGKKPLPFRLNENYEDPRDIQKEWFKKANFRVIILDNESNKDTKE